MKFNALKTYFVFLIISLTSFPVTFCAVHAEDYFEGILTFKMGAEGKQTEMMYFMKGSKMRMEVQLAPGFSSAGIADYEKKKIYMLMPPTGTYNEMDIDEKALKAAPASEISDIKETGETAEILGHTCYKIISEKQNERTEIWIAKGFGKFYQPEMGKSATFAALQKKFEEEKAFPFRIVSFGPEQKEVFRMEVTNIDKKPLDDALFSVPEGYKKVSMPPAPKSK